MDNHQISYASTQQMPAMARGFLIQINCGEPDIRLDLTCPIQARLVVAARGQAANAQRAQSVKPAPSAYPRSTAKATAPRSVQRSRFLYPVPGAG